LVFIGIRRATRIRILILLVAIVLIMAARICAGAFAARMATSSLKPVSRVETSSKIVAFTFDLTFGESAPGKVLDALASAGAKATFFVAGPYAKAHPDVVRRIVQEGHEIASQGYWHENLSAAEDSRVRESIARTHDILKSFTGVEPSLFRPPNGDYDDRVIRSALEVGYSTITWSLDSFDWRNTTADYIRRRVAGKARQGDIVRFHASDMFATTSEVIPGIISDLRARGLQASTVGELLRSAQD